MRLAKAGPGNGIVVGIDEKWFDLRQVEGYERVSRIADVDEGLADQVRRQADRLDVVNVDLDHADPIAERDTAIWGAGLNYRRHSADLEAEQPGSGPGSYLRPGNCLIGNLGTIELPAQSKRVTAEAELGLVIGRRCKNVSRESWREVVAGVTAVLDMTAEDVIRENPRYIPWAKGFDTFCSVGPVMVTLDEFDSLDSIHITTVRNDEDIATATPVDMKYDIGYLVEYFSAGRTLEPGTVISTGTPGAVPIEPGDVVRAVVENVGTLTHPVR